MCGETRSLALMFFLWILQLAVYHLDQFNTETSPSTAYFTSHPSFQPSSSSPVTPPGWAESWGELAPVQNAWNFSIGPISPAKLLINLHISLPDSSLPPVFLFNSYKPYQYSLSHKYSVSACLPRLSDATADLQWHEPNCHVTCEYLFCLLSFYVSRQFPKNFKRHRWEQDLQEKSNIGKVCKDRRTAQWGL